jgi:hypothetical protein
VDAVVALAAASDAFVVAVAADAATAAALITKAHLEAVTSVDNVPEV